MKEIKGTVRLHLWIESDEGMMLGLGRMQLIQNIEECGSLQTAAKKMGISYRAAWGRIKKTEEVLGYKLLEKSYGGYQLTQLGKELNEMYLRWFNNVETYALKEAKKIFPWISTSFKKQESEKLP
jgi:molybdate transport system regulatory protein